MIERLGLSAPGPIRKVAQPPAGPVAARPAAAQGGPAPAEVLGTAPVDAAHVAELRASLAAGTYRVDSRAIAERMIAMDLPTT